MIAIVDLGEAPKFITSPDSLKSWVYRQLEKKGMPVLWKPPRPAVPVEVWHDSISNYKYFFQWETE